MNKYKAICDDVTLSEFLEISTCFKEPGNYYRVEFPIFNNTETCYVVKCFGFTEFEAKEDAFNYVLQVLAGEESSRAFVREPKKVEENQN